MKLVHMAVAVVLSLCLSVAALAWDMTPASDSENFGFSVERVLPHNHANLLI